MIIGKRLDTAMKKKNIRNRDITEKAKQMGIHIGSSAIAQYRSGKYAPKQDRLAVLAQILDVSEAWLLGIDDDVVLTKNESILVQQYRKLSDEDKKYILKIINTLNK